MINNNGNLVEIDNDFVNRAFLYGDGVFETCKIVRGKVLFLEDHYFRLMASMRIVRMEIPMNFTIEYFEKQIINLIQAKNISNSARVRITVYRNNGGFYLPKTNEVSFVIQAEALQDIYYSLNNFEYEIDLYKDFYVPKHLLSNIKTTNKIINITGSVFAQENKLSNCILLNETKNAVEALHGNIFIVCKNQVFTPPLSEGCLNGIMRKNIILLIQKHTLLDVFEKPISTFELQNADEIWITNVIKGIQIVTKFRKKNYLSVTAKIIIEKLNGVIDGF